MPKAIPNPDVSHPSVTAKPMPTADRDPANLRLWGRENPLPAEHADPGTDTSLLAALAADRLPAAPADDLASLLAENDRLRRIIEELRTNRDDTARQGESTWLARQKEYENLLEEKSELIRSLHVQVQELQDAPPPAPATPKEEELLAFSEELERERCRLKQDQKEVEELRQRLTDDEQEMQRQMRDMEVQMARERADFARQRTELQRILDDIRRELENVERNGDLNQRLGQLRQRFQDVAIGRGSQHSISVPAGAKTPAAGAAKSSDKKEDPRGSRKDSSLLMRLFSKG